MKRQILILCLFLSSFEFLYKNEKSNKKINISQILARGQIVRDEQHLVTDPSSLQTTYSFVITSEMSPSLLLLASYNGPKNEIVADYVRLNVEVGLENQVCPMLGNVFLYL